MASPSELDIGKVLGLTLAFDYLMKNGYVDAAEDLALRIEMSDNILVSWNKDDLVTVITDPRTGDDYRLTDKAFT